MGDGLGVTPHSLPLTQYVSVVLPSTFRPVVSRWFAERLGGRALGRLSP